jgi:hypothetical protein
MCVATDSDGWIVHWDGDPTSVRHRALPTPLLHGLGDLSCASPVLCFAFDGAGNLFASTQPTGEVRAWSLVYKDPGTTYGMKSVACPSAEECLAIDYQGQLLAGGPPPTRAQLRAWLSSVLALTGAVSARSLLRHGGYKLHFAAPYAGALRLDWYAQARTDRGHARQVVVARFQRMLDPIGAINATIRLTPQGKRLLVGGGATSLIAKGTYPSADGTTVSVSRTVRLTG